jgi:ethanolamine ammonia-lyase small subunit
MSNRHTDLPEPHVEEGPWTQLRRLTAARIGLQRSGASLATQPMLELRLAHARARDAVHQPLDHAQLVTDLAGLRRPLIDVASRAIDRQSYLMRPDLGRALAVESEPLLRLQPPGHDVVFVVADGLSAVAVQRHAVPILSRVLAALPANWRVAPIVIARYGRVAIGDAIAEALKPECVAVLIGERPGLSAPDSMGAYLTWRPHRETTDADRNCISNIRPDGIGYDDAAFKLVRLLLAMRSRGISGVALKDESERPAIE